MLEDIQQSLVYTSAHLERIRVNLLSIKESIERCEREHFFPPDSVAVLKGGLLFAFEIGK
jgi:hypothetical protein